MVNYSSDKTNAINIERKERQERKKRKKGMEKANAAIKYIFHSNLNFDM